MKKPLVTFALLLPPILSFLVLGAHFLRDGRLILALVCLALIAGLFVRKPRPARLAQIALWLGTLEWIVATYGLAVERIGMGIPWTRMGIILGAVSLFTLLSSFVFSTNTMKRRYGLSSESASAEEATAE